MKYEGQLELSESKLVVPEGLSEGSGGLSERSKSLKEGRCPKTKREATAPTSLTVS